MDFVKLKNLVKQNGDKFVFVENGEPEMVMMSFREYEKLIQGGVNVKTPANYANSGGNFYRTELIDSGAKETAGLPARIEDIRLDDLPI